MFVILFNCRKISLHAFPKQILHPVSFMNAIFLFITAKNDEDASLDVLEMQNLTYTQKNKIVFASKILLYLWVIFQKMERLIHILFDFGYVTVFGILAATTLLLHIPKEKGMESYKKARMALGIALASMSLYCVLRLFIPQSHNDYEDFWILVTYSLIFSWLSYASILFLIETPRYMRRNFLIDGVVPIVLIVILGVIGLFRPSIQRHMMVLFGIVFGLKCTWMCFTCWREYRKCVVELDNYYDESPDLRWIGTTIILSYMISISTIVAFYISAVHLVYYLSLPILFTFFVFRIINYAPKKVDVIRRQNQYINKPQEVKKERNADLDSKIAPLLDKWVTEKGFCTPELTIKDVAQSIGTNHNYLSSYLNNYLGMTFQVWLNTLRIKESQRLLTDGQRRSIEEIGVLVGIPQSYNFSRWFRAVTGTTPFKYRKEN